jgi:CheY-like chemotaxis protein
MSKILVADDSQELLELFSFLLQEKGYTVQTASSKNSFLNRLSDFIPDVILIDVKLNGEDGRQLCREIKQGDTTKGIPVILLSTSPELLNDYEECGANDVIEKPFEISSVLQKIEKVLTLSRLQH